jgi:hypothetical protein
MGCVCVLPHASEVVASPPPQEAKAQLGGASMLPAVLAFVTPSAPPALQAAALRLLNNLAFDTQLRRGMAAAGVAARCVDVLLCQPLPQIAQGPEPHGAAGAQAQLQPLSLGLLYLVSMERGGRGALASPDLLSR